LLGEVVVGTATAGAFARHRCRRPRLPVGVPATTGNEVPDVLARYGVFAMEKCASKKLQVACPYCGKQAAMVTGKEVYPHRPDLFEKTFYQCAPCDAYVGCHPGTRKPLGRLADATLRVAKRRAHDVFDPLWRQSGRSRKSCYAWLAGKLNIAVEDCHIGMFDVSTCHLVIKFCGSEIA
jgi:hypothetical protein